ncbi:MAG TPA: CoA-binding protein [Dehalococcoidia bacterium]
MQEKLRRLERAWSPRTVAVVGDKRVTGYMWLRAMRPFTGRLYSVQVDPAEIPGIEELGIPNYRSLQEIPDEIDYVLCAVPRAVAPRIVADCAAKGVAGVALFTSGFAETGEEEGIRLQAEVARIAAEADLALVGPNCMGLYNPRAGIRQSGEQPTGESGPVGFISQSGTHAINLSLVAAHNGLRLSKSASIGNAVALDVPDYLEVLAADPDTRVIAMYVEGVKDGRRFFQTLRRVAREKPVVVWKGGQTEAGARATASHTASLASSTAVWNAVMRQTGAIPADTLDEVVDVLKALLLARAPAGPRMALMAMTGGPSVGITDAFARAGLEVPLLSDASYRRLGEFFNVIGGSYRNPLDTGGTLGQNPDNLRRILEILDEDPHVDAIVMEVSGGFMARRWVTQPEALEGTLGTLTAFRDRSAKPFFAVFYAGHMEEAALTIRPRFQEAGIPLFPTYERAALAIRRALDYRRFLAAADGEPA